MCWETVITLELGLLDIWDVFAAFFCHIWVKTSTNCCHCFS